MGWEAKKGSIAGVNAQNSDRERIRAAAGKGSTAIPSGSGSAFTKAVSCAGAVITEPFVISGEQPTIWA